jgi:hypothetical protein
MQYQVDDILSMQGRVLWQQHKLQWLRVCNRKFGVYIRGR